MQLLERVDTALSALQSGATSLASYLAAHVLLCLVPAFFVAGVLAALVPKEAVTRFLGRKAPRWVAYPMAAIGGSLIAVCSCTVLPLFASIQRKGAGLGPAVTFLFFAPAGNILALSYTGVALGGEFALARVVFSAVFGIGIGLSMAALFPREDGPDPGEVKVASTKFPRGVAPLLAALVVLLLAGTLKLGFLDAVVATSSWPVRGAAALSEALARWFPFDPARGEEGVTVQGLALIGVLVAWGLLAWRGFTHVDDAITKTTVAALVVTVVMLIVAALRVGVEGDGLRVSITGRTVAVALVLGAVVALARRLDTFDAQQWLWESWRFVRQIAPLLLVGVFVVGLVRVFIRPEWVHAIAGENTVLANATGVGFGVFMYFPTLVEVPVAKLFLSLGMHPGPLLAYLMADPELSLQSILVISKLIGARRTAAWVGLVAVFSLGAGLLWGARADGAGLGWLGLGAVAWLAGIVLLVRLVSWLINRRPPLVGVHP
ncbi:MAG: permease [Archangium sp.]|nr:permease [Archangium sp.]